MKKVLTMMALLPIAFTFASCGGSDSGNTTDSTTATTTQTTSDGTVTSAGTDSSMANSVSGGGQMKESYMDLSTNKRVKVQRDEKSGRYVNMETHQPIDFYYDPETHDTFDVQGRNVNMALIKNPQGKYTINEAKVKVQGDNDIKMKSADGNTKIKLETDGDAKVKTDSSKIKIKDGKVIEKKH